MGIAYSGETPPLWAQNIQGSTTTALLNGIHQVMLAAGIPFTAITDGWEFTLTSPQDSTLQCKVRIVDVGTPPGGQPQLIVKFRSTDDARLGYPHPLIAHAGRVYEMIISKTQLAISLTGYSSDQPEALGWGLAVIGGVPFIPELPLFCLNQTPPEEPTVTEAWWSSGTDNNVLSSPKGRGFRSSWQNQWAWDACWNGQLVSGYSSPEPSILRMAVIAQPFPDYGIFVSAQQTRWYNGAGLYYEPFLIWGETPQAIGKLRGQIWDAMAHSIDKPLEDEIMTEEFDPVTAISYGNFYWRNFMHYQGDMSKGAAGSYYSSLYLLKDYNPTTTGGIESNCVY